jgi:hypothetical protein
MQKGLRIHGGKDKRERIMNIEQGTLNDEMNKE